jgi:hypothetical protein
LRGDDPALQAAARRSSGYLRSGAAQEGANLATGDTEALMIAAWSLVHGLATLWLTGNIPLELGPPDALARRVLAVTDAPA